VNILGLAISLVYVCLNIINKLLLYLVWSRRRRRVRVVLSNMTFGTVDRNSELLAADRLLLAGRGVKKHGAWPTAQTSLYLRPCHNRPTTQRALSLLLPTAYIYATSNYISTSYDGNRTFVCLFFSAVVAHSAHTTTPPRPRVAVDPTADRQHSSCLSSASVLPPTSLPKAARPVIQPDATPPCVISDIFYQKIEL
jgi:hypothetical protein